MTEESDVDDGPDRLERLAELERQAGKADGGPTDADRLRDAWVPHDGGQRKVLEADARFKIVACGRRWGKTELAAFTAAEYALDHPNSLVWWVAPNYNQADVGVRTLRGILPDAVDVDLTRSVPKAVRFDNGAEISFRSADHPDTLRGVGLDYLAIDEASWVSPEAWHEALRPTLADTEGGMMAISTPRARNWFWKVYQRGEGDGYGDYRSFRYPTASNPYISHDEIDEARKAMPDRAFRAEFEAEFLPGGGTVFTTLDNVLEEYHPSDESPEGYCRTGVDFARHDAATVILTLDARGRVVHFKRITEGAWPQIQAAVERAYDRFEGTVLLDATRDNKIVADLEAAGVTAEPIKFTAERKREMIENLITKIEAAEVALPSTIEVLIRELETFEYDTTAAGNVRYAAPAGFHDDCVDALALAASENAEPLRAGGFDVTDMFAPVTETGRRRGTARDRRPLTPADTMPSVLKDDDEGGGFF